MKSTMYEHDGSFEFTFEAESVADAAMLARFALNATKDIQYLDATAYKDGTFTGYLRLGKRMRPNGDIKP